MFYNKFNGFSKNVLAKTYDKQQFCWLEKKYYLNVHPIIIMTQILAVYTISYHVIEISIISYCVIKY